MSDYDKQFYQANKPRLLPYFRRRRVERKAAGLCYDCSAPTEGKVRCRACNISQRLDRIAFTPEERSRAEQAALAFDGHCQCCGTTEPKGAGWSIDHCHRTMKFRGILCQGCNHGLGAFADCVLRMLKAIAYVRRTR